MFLPGQECKQNPLAFKLVELWPTFPTTYEHGHLQRIIMLTYASQLLHRSAMVYRWNDSSSDMAMGMGTVAVTHKVCKYVILAKVDQPI